MKDLFSESCRIGSVLSDKGKREHRFYLILQIVLFLLASFSMWEFLYELCNIIGSFVSGCPPRGIEQIIRMMPMILTAFSYVGMSIRVCRAYTAPSAEKRARIWKRGGFTTIVVGAIIAMYVIIGVIVGEYDRLVEGFFTPLFPLDLCIGGFLMMIYGIFADIYSQKIIDGGSELPCPARHGCLVMRVVDRVFYFLGVCVSMCAFAACVYGLWVMDWSHGAVFFNVMLWLNYFTAFAMLFVYRFVFCELKDEHRRSAQVRLGLIFLCVNVVLFGLYLVSVQIFNEAPNQNAYGIIPIDFTASFNAFAVVMGLNNLLSPAAALIKGLIAGKKKK